MIVSQLLHSLRWTDESDLLISIPHLLQFDVLHLSHLDKVRRNFILGIVQSWKRKYKN